MIHIRLYLTALIAQDNISWLNNYYLEYDSGFYQFCSICQGNTGASVFVSTKDLAKVIFK